MRNLRNAIGGLLLAWAAGSLAAEPVRILFVGNSFTYTRPPALQYNIDNVTDLNAQNRIDFPAGSDPALPQPWGGVPGIFKALTDQAGLAYDVRHSLRGGATLRGHLLNTNPAGWDMRANIASDRWDVVVLQGNSTEALNRAGGNYIQFSAYVGLLNRFITVGDAFSYRDRDFYPGTTAAAQTAACMAATGTTTTTQCNTTRNIPANTNFNPLAKVVLYQTWARPDLTYPPGGPYSGEPLETMTEDLRQAYSQAALENAGIAGVVPVGEAFMRAVHDGVAMRNPYEPVPRLVDLWWFEDQFHSSVYGSYLSALVMFGALTGIDPSSFGANEKAASDLGIKPREAMELQRVASGQLTASGYGLKTLACLHASPKAKGARPCAPK
jgi:hypothetical protein